MRVAYQRRSDAAAMAGNKLKTFPLAAMGASANRVTVVFWRDITNAA